MVTDGCHKHTSTHAQGTDPRVALGAEWELWELLWIYLQALQPEPQRRKVAHLETQVGLGSHSYAEDTRGEERHRSNIGRKGVRLDRVRT